MVYMLAPEGGGYKITPAEEHAALAEQWAFDSALCPALNQRPWAMLAMAGLSKASSMAMRYECNALLIRMKAVSAFKKQNT